MINDRIRELRHDLKLSQKEFANRLAISQTHIASLETKTRKVTHRIAGDICRVFYVRPQWLFDGELPMYIDALSGLEVDSDVKELAKQYIKLSDKDKSLVRELVNSLAEKL